MKNNFAILLLVFLTGISQTLFAQQEITPANESTPAIGYTFPMGIKLKLKLIPPQSDTASYQYTIIDQEEFKDTLYVNDVQKLFSKNESNDIIEVFFSIGYYSKPDLKEKTQKMQSIMTLKNHTNKALNYNADIVPYGKQEFENTSVSPLLPNVISTEIWPYYIPVIALYDFKNWKINIK